MIRAGIQRPTTEENIAIFSSVATFHTSHALHNVRGALAVVDELHSLSIRVNLRLVNLVGADLKEKVSFTVRD